MIVISHPTGNQNSRQAIQAFAEVAALQKFYTALNISSGNLLCSLLPKGIVAELMRRDFAGIAGNSRVVESLAVVRELLRLISTKFGLPSLVLHEEGWACVDAIYHTVDCCVAKKIETIAGSVTSVYAYEDGALETFKMAQGLGVERIYELPIGYWRSHRLLWEEEASLNSKWAETWRAGKDSITKLQRKDKELSLASKIIVPSDFVAKSLNAYPGVLPPVSVVPYGCPDPISLDERRWYSGGILRVLFVGELSQRKGLSYLLDAVDMLGSAVELTVIGSGPAELLIGTKHRQLGSVPYAAVLDEMRRNDIFVFPSLFEGFGMVITEALSQGMPVIVTPNTGPGSMISDGVEGWVVPLRDSESIAGKLKSCVDNPSLVQRMGRAALLFAQKNSWLRYRESLREAVLEREGGEVNIE